METVSQALKYGVVGVGNTLLTAGVIWMMMRGFGMGDVVANGVGYAAGVLNSFVWNRQWTFRSKESWVASGLRFFAVFLVCYVLQLCILLLLRHHLSMDPYYNQLFAMGVYTLANFVLNKYVTFKSYEKQ
ncbi:MAG: GtrA family protein [Tannerellaceae bacterium]|jgi:putative flippase GtrA|nr:GtrA family protein [Tannerellaceae bacterium]